MRGKQNWSRIIKTAIPGFAGFGYFYYIYSAIEVQNPHMVFFTVLISIFIALCFLSKQYFATIFTIVAISTWIILNTDALVLLQRALAPLGIYFY